MQEKKISLSPEKKVDPPLNREMHLKKGFLTSISFPIIAVQFPVKSGMSPHLIQLQVQAVNKLPRHNKLVINDAISNY